ncbi:Two pore calcium channel protein 1A, partial [Bienertia sinuspersici]
SKSDHLKKKRKMDKPLLRGESSRHSYVFNRRSDAITHGSVYQRAAALVDLAEDGVGLPEEILDESKFESSAKLYFAYTRLDILWTINYFAMIALNFLEKPLWCEKYNDHSCSDREYFFLGQLPYLTGAESLISELHAWCCGLDYSVQCPLTYDLFIFLILFIN